jgi:hypothetical protein
MHDDGLRMLLTTLDPKARDDFRRYLIADQPDRDEITSMLPCTTATATAWSGPT